MNQRLAIHIETTIHHRALSSWTSVVRRGKFSTDTQFFALFGFSDAEFDVLSPQDRESASDLFDYALRLATAFEYIPLDPAQAEQFFEKKLAIFENKIKERADGLPRLNAGLGIVAGTQLFFTSSGDIAILHVGGNAISNFGEMGATGPLHFNTFHNGALTPHTYLLVIPKHLAPLLKSNDLKEIARSRSSENKLASIKRAIETRNVQPPIFRAVLLEAKPQLLRPTESTGTSIANLLKTEANTEETLSPPLLKPFIKSIHSSINQAQKTLKDFSDNLVSKIKILKNKITIPVEHAQPTKLTAAKTRRAAVNAAAPATLALKKYKTISSYFIRLAKYPQKAVQITQKTRASVAHVANIAWLKQKLLSLIRARLDKLATQFNNLSLKSKLIFIALLVLIFAFTQSVLFANRREKINSAENQLQTEVVGIQTLIDTAKASLIYNDEAKARLQIDEAKARLQNLPAFKRQLAANVPLRYLKSAATDEKTAEELASTIRDTEERLRHIIVIENPSAALDLRELLPDAKGIILKDNIVFVYSANSLVWSRNNVTQKLTPENLASFNLALAHQNRNTILLISNDKTYLYNYMDNKVNEPITLRGNARDAAIYNRRLYTLHQGDNQIYKYEPTAQGFSSGIAWIKDGTRVNTAQALVVDGTAYVLEESGNIIELRKGVKTNFILKAIDPPLTHAIKLWTNETSPYIYVLDTSENRLIVFNKTDGSLKAQYKSPSFTNLKDFAINETQKTAYLLAGTRVISFSLSHLKK